MPFLFQESSFLNDWVCTISNDQERDAWMRSLEYGDQILKGKVCPYCRTLLRAWYSIWDGIPAEWCEHESHERLLLLCPACTWFAHSCCLTEPDNYTLNTVCYSAFASGDPIDQLPIPLLREHLSRKWGDKSQITAAQAEDLVVGIFKDSQDCEVHYLSDGVFTPDGGIDFVLVEGDSGLSTAFQIKRRLSSKSESVMPVREFIGSLVLSNYSNGCYVTFADRFSKSCRDELKRGADFLRSKNLTLELVDGERLKFILRQHKQAHLAGHPFRAENGNPSRGRWQEIPLDEARMIMWAYTGNRGKEMAFSELLKAVWLQENEGGTSLYS